MAKNLSRKVTIYIDGKPAEASIQQLYQRISQLRNEQAKLPIGTQEYIDKSRELARLNAIYKDQKSAANDLGNSWKSASEKLAGYSNILMGIQSLFQMADAGIGKLKDLVADAAELDDAYADVMKTTGLTRDQVLQLNESFKKMDTRTAREQLNQLAYEAGKLGINSTQQVEQFVRAADKINIALGDVLGEGAMVTIGKLADVYSKSTAQLTAAGDDLEKKMLSIGSAVNQLGQSSTANEGYLVEFLSRMGGIATQANLSADAILGFASALDQDMMKQEMSATAFQKFIMQLIKKPAEFAAAAHMEVKEFTELMQRDMNEALLRVLEGFKGQGGLVSLQPIFEDLGLDAARAASVISSMANSIDQIREAQAIANDELTTGSSIIREFTTKNNTMQAQAEKAKKAFQDMRLELGEQLYPVVIHLTRLSTSVIKGLSGYLTLWKENRAAAAALTTATITLVAWITRHRIATLASNAATAIKNKLDDLARISILRKAAATAKATAAVEKERLSTLKAELAEAKKIATMKVEASDYSALTVKTMAQGRATSLLTAITKQETVATEASIAATKAKSAALRATPWGLIIAGISAAAYGLAKLIQHQHRFKTEASETNKAIASQSTEANYLFDKLERLNSSSEEYKETLDKLNQLYPDILKKYDLERAGLMAIRNARQEVIDKIREQIVEQRRLDKLSELEGDYTEKYENAAKKIQSIIGNQQQFNDIMAALPKSYTEDFTAYTKAAALAGEKYEAIIPHIVRIQKIQKDLYNDQKEYNDLYNAIFGKDSQSNTDNDPFNLAGKSIVTLKKQLEKFQKEYKDIIVQVNSLQQQLNDSSNKRGDRSGIELQLYRANQQADNLNKKMEAYRQAITNLSPKPEPTSSSTSDFIPDTAQAEKDLKKWQQVKEQAERLISDFSAKAQSGLSRTLAEIENRSASLRRDIEESVGATRQQKDALIAQINEAEDAYKRAKIDEYIKKLTTEAAKLGDTGSQPVDRVRQAAAQLAQQLAEIDNQINAISDDLQRKDITDSQRQQLEALIQQYAAAKQHLSASAFRGIDTAVDTSSFSLSGDIDKDTKEYERLTKQIENARQATEELSNLAKDPAQRQEYELQTLALIEQQRTLDEIYSGAEQFANKVRQGKLLDNLISNLQFFGDQALDILGNIFQIVNNIGQRELREAEQLKDRNIANLDDQLAQGLISQEQYDNRKTKLEEDYQAKQKEIELEAWRREKLLNSSQAAMAAALAILRVWSDAGNGTTAMRAAQTAVVGAATLAQIAAIASEPEPYARGGYVRDKKIMVGEAGSEWIASHRLLSDPVTAPVIAALDSYQRLPAMAAVNLPAVNQVSSQRNEFSRINAALLAEMRRLADYLSDPANRRAVISRRTQETFDANENFLRNAARL